MASVDTCTTLMVVLAAGFGKTAAFRSLRADSMYSMDTREATDLFDESSLADCSSAGGFTRPYDAAHTWSHI